MGLGANLRRAGQLVRILMQFGRFTLWAAHYTLSEGRCTLKSARFTLKATVHAFFGRRKDAIISSLLQKAR